MSISKLKKALDIIDNYNVESITISILWVRDDNHRYWKFYEFNDISQLRHAVINFSYNEDFISTFSLWIGTANDRLCCDILRHKHVSSKNLDKHFKHIMKWIDERPELLI